MAEEYYTVQQAAEYLGVKEESVRYWIRHKNLPAKRSGLRGLRIKVDDLVKFATDNNMLIQGGAPE